MHKTFLLQFSFLYIIYSLGGYNRNKNPPPANTNPIWRKWCNSVWVQYQVYHPTHNTPFIWKLDINLPWYNYSNQSNIRVEIRLRSKERKEERAILLSQYWKRSQIYYLMIGSLAMLLPLPFSVFPFFRPSNWWRCLFNMAAFT